MFLGRKITRALIRKRRETTPVNKTRSHTLEQLYLPRVQLPISHTPDRLKTFATYARSRNNLLRRGRDATPQSHRKRRTLQEHENISRRLRTPPQLRSLNSVLDNPILAYIFVTKVTHFLT